MLKNLKVVPSYVAGLKKKSCQVEKSRTNWTEENPELKLSMLFSVHKRNVIVKQGEQTGYLLFHRNFMQNEGSYKARIQAKHMAFTRLFASVHKIYTTH